MKQILTAAAMAIAIALGGTAPQAKPFEEVFPLLAQTGDPELVEDLKRLDFKQGEVQIGGGIAKLNVDPDRYYYLDGKDARIVLEEFWGNPPNPDTLGMIFPIDATPFHSDTWAAEMNFDEIGYVKDEDAESYDYSELLVEMKKDTRAANEWRVENGYQGIELVGWAAEPSYERAGRKLHWAKEISFTGDPENTLNYNIRALGRRGVLVVNFIAGMEQLGEVEQVLPDMLAMIDFADGHRYADFDPGLDKVAAVGIGGLIAGKVLAKTGLFAVALIFLKKFWFLLFIPLGYAWRVMRNRGDGGSGQA
ncbi:putative membrane protein [Candidatus Rhodobacter oscarellae]|uniref:Putative membrane protein n=1 Tax=Candidatus Rhodobacter oscarellae TaxID=1675527 RepID=A0A0J9EEL6_9RHOB|nr:DUF2167 domain-containing protein [Candidatus Rhodobacter lobularis]KMW60134.1 putative membrane protein [Candidatus Rhodobacter lobularis]